MSSIRIFSFGGGVQSVSVLAIQYRHIVYGDYPDFVPYDRFVYADVGLDAEPDTAKFFYEHVSPFCSEHGIPLFIARRKTRAGSDTPTLLETVRAARDIPLPVHLGNGGSGIGNRWCTENYKIRVINRHIADIRPRVTSAVIGLGISWDEVQRVRPKMTQPHRSHHFMRRVDYPLIDLRLRRVDLPAIIQSVGLPVPPKSSCWFCPLHSRGYWVELRAKNPQRFADALALEQMLSERRIRLGRDGCVLSPGGLQRIDVLQENFF